MVQSIESTDGMKSKKMPYTKFWGAYRAKVV